MENPIRDCGIPSEVNLFFRSERNGEKSLPFRKLSSFQSHQPTTITEIEFQIVSAQASQTHDSRNRSNIYDLSTRIE